MSCSHKKKVLNFLDQLCSFYASEYMLASSILAEGTQAFIDKVCELADANGIPSNGYKSILSEFSVDEFRGHLNKVCNNLLSFEHVNLKNNNDTHSCLLLESIMYFLGLNPNNLIYEDWLSNMVS